VSGSTLVGRRTPALVVTAAVSVLVVVVVFLLLPPLPASAPAPSWSPSANIARGVMHVHTRRSDGTGSVDEVAAAAANAGLQFVIVTDHGDATRQPDPPAYRSGVLCIDAVEISTTGGHYAALGLGPAPYPLGGEPRDVADDVRRLGGFGIVAHPLSPRPELAWSGWDARVDAIEWLNGDSVWRDASLARLLGAASTYPLRPVASVASLFRRPGALARWDALSKGQRLVGLAGADAHARLGFSDGREPYVSPVYIRVPSYRTSFEVASLRVRLPQPLGRDPARDADAILGAIRAGHVHTVVDALARPAAFEFTATSGAVPAGEGDTLPATEPVVVRVRANQPPGGWIVLFRNGSEIHRVAADELVYASDRQGTYRAEVWLPASGSSGLVPWIVGNPVYVGNLDRPAAQPPLDMSGPAVRLEPADTLWGVERDAGSVADLERSADGIGIRYVLGTTPTATPFAALDATTTIPSGVAGIAFRGRADRPMRVSVQLRVVTAGEGKRWHRSIYLDQAPRDVAIPFADMKPIGALAKGEAEVAEVRTVLFVVDRVNARRGASGRFVLEQVRFFSPGAPGR
jgi:hypothetical protein